MSALKNVQHEMFAVAVAEGRSTVEAYDHAGYKAKDAARSVGAAKLAARPDIQARIAEIKAPAINRAVAQAQISREYIIEKLAKNARICMGEEPIKLKVWDKKLGQVKEVEVIVHEPTAANQALMLLGKDMGMFVESQVPKGDTYVIIAPQPARIDNSSGKSQADIEAEWSEGALRNVTPIQGALSPIKATG